jgi:outer membrane biosynthesis protein TonB
MPKNEDGEFELILGNKQLLGVFFIAVVLLGVFFTMGYIVGRNSSPLAATEVASAKDSKPMVVESPAREHATAAAAATPPEPAKVEEPAKEVSKPEPAKPEPAKPEPPKPEPVKPAKAEAPKPEPAKAPVGGSQPIKGQVYLQLAATTQHEADIEVDILVKKGFKSLSMEIPDKRGTFRVLVGPLAEGAVAQTRTELKNAGFPGERAFKQKF